MRTCGSHLSSRRAFLGRSSQWSALLAAYQFLPRPALAESPARDSRVAQTPIESGAQPGTSDPSAPCLPPGGVTPPGPLKYGTLAAR
jgi:hypothetical protein